MHPESRLADEILEFILPSERNLFTELSASVHWEDVGKGRRAAVLTRVDEAGVVPLVRTTTQYGGPAQRFQTVHERLAQRIRKSAELPIGFNNALVENYTNAYKTMGGHSDQALDLADDSHIAVFSCYERPEVSPQRKIIFEAKGPGGEKFEIPLAQHSVVAFSVKLNRLLRHKIVLDTAVRSTENQWLGVTFRASKTLLRFRDGHAYLPQGARLMSADDEGRHEFYRLRRRENTETDFNYPPLTYTISESDLMPPV
ncbi:hypothetical protein [Streptomyces candidus]|uniref:Uncharacterized protein n=1 Tax=Streptomyces candidus TaxID=67283 RepID=A0A7X0HG84_9ACTN|nr:hypothetical protein [Streptomyces candidus]MBB6435919.1 hypothetical protein [Streptomyces candidus]GHH42966.1 hypothetical protein GCM10018773_28200 [Streptomyces candidus]